MRLVNRYRIRLEASTEEKKKYGRPNFRARMSKRHVPNRNQIFNTAEEKGRSLDSYDLSIW
jgi:hypothetical protein